MDSGKEGPTIFLLAGTHGNEPAGFKGAEQLLERLEPKTGRIILVPHANQQAIELNQRTASDGVDMNRSYPLRQDRKSHSGLVCTDYGADPKISASLCG